MAVSAALRRLLHVRQQEEEQGRAALESAVADLHRFEDAHASAVRKERQGRERTASSARSGELADRLAGLEETRSAKRVAIVLRKRIEAAGRQAEALRETFLESRVARMQTETLVEETEARDAMEAARRAQQELDDMHRAAELRARATARTHSTSRSLSDLCGRSDARASSSEGEGIGQKT